MTILQTQNRALIGPDKSGHAEYAPTSAGIQAALDMGSRWLVFMVDAVQIDYTINLDAYTGTYLRLEGAAERSTNLFRQSTVGPVFKSLTSTWILNFSGVTFTGPTASADPSLSISRLRRSHFENCAWVDSPGRGAEFGVNGGFAEELLFQHCTISQNHLEGMVIENIKRSTIQHCIIERNGLSDPLSRPSLLVKGVGTSPPDITSGSSMIIENHFETDNRFHKLVSLDTLYFTDVLRNYFYLGDLSLEQQTGGCEVKRNRRVGFPPSVYPNVVNNGVLTPPNVLGTSGSIDDNPTFY